MAVDSVFCADKEKLTRALLWRRQRRGWLQFQRPFEQQFRQSPAVVWNTGPPSGLMTPSPRLWRCSLRLRNCNVIQKNKKTKWERIFIHLMVRRRRNNRSSDSSLGWPLITATPLITSFPIHSGWVISRYKCNSEDATFLLNRKWANLFSDNSLCTQFSVFFPTISSPPLFLRLRLSFREHV